MLKIKIFSGKINRLRELFIITVFGGLPTLAFGVVLRRYFYRFICSHIGHSVFIQSFVELLEASAICLEDNVHIFKNVRIDARGENNVVHLASSVALEHGVSIGAMSSSKLKIGERTFIGPYTLIAGTGDITIGKDCLIAGHSGIFANNHNFSDCDSLIREQGLTCKGIEIQDNCWLGHGVTVLDGVTIGRDSVIGAGAVVNKDIPPGSIAVGVPARVISNRYNSLSFSR